MSYVPKNARFEKEVKDGAVTYAKLDSNGKTRIYQMRNSVQEATAATTFDKSFCRIKEGGTITAVYYIPDTSFGQATNFSALNVMNKGLSGSGSTVVSLKNYNASVPAFVAGSFAISNPTVAAGEVLSLYKNIAGTGQLVPPGDLIMAVERTA